MDGGRETEHGPAEPVASGPEEAGGEHDDRQPDRSISMLGAHQRHDVDHAVFGDVTDKNDERGRDRQGNIGAQRVHDHGQRLKAHHAKQSAERDRQRDFRDSRQQQHGADLVQDGPQLDVIDVKRISGRVLNDPRHDLRALDRHLPGRKLDGTDGKSENATDNQHANGSDP